METILERSRSTIVEVIFSRRRPTTLGGDQSLPFHRFESPEPLSPPVLALEISLGVPEWPRWLLDEAGADCDPVSWTRHAAEKGAGAICLSLSADIDDVGGYTKEAVTAVGRILEAVPLPLMVSGSGNRDVDNAVVPEVAKTFAGERLLLGTVTQENYDAIAQACIDHEHVIIAQSPIDINICKQLNILLTERGLPLDRIVIDPTTGGLGYGVEYTYSIMEKARLAALQGDRMLSCPQVCFVGAENWKVKETASDDGDLPGSWGNREKRGVLWEATAGMSLLMAGASLLVMRSPLALALVKEQVKRFSSARM